MKTALTLLALFSAVAALPAHAQTTSASTLDTLREQALWEVQLHPQKLFASPLGSLINELLLAKIPDGEKSIQAFVEALGFDPRSSIQEVIVFGSEFSENAPHVVANLGSNSGNLEGWLIAAPGYQSETLEGDLLLHSFVHEGKHGRVWCAIPRRASDESRFLVAGFDRQQVVDLVSSIQSGSTAPASNSATGNSVLSVSVSDLTKLPMEIDNDNPGAAIVTMIKRLTISADAEKDSLVANCRVTADSPARAEQIQQLLTGMKAMGQLALAQEKSPEKQEILNTLQKVQVNFEKGAAEVSTSVSLDYDMIKSVIKEKAN